MVTDCLLERFSQRNNLLRRGLLKVVISPYEAAVSTVH